MTSQAATASTATELPSSTSSLKPTAVYLPPSASAASSSSSSKGGGLAGRFKTAIIPPPPAEDPKPTVSELKAAYASTIERNQRMGLGPDAPLMTQSMRDKHEAKHAKPKKTFDELRIRFRFPDRTQVEYLVPSSTPLLSLYHILRTSLRKMIPFTLYTSPPRQEYLESDTKLAGKRLSDMGWGGGAVVLVKWTDAQAAGPTTSPFLKEELLAIAQPLEPPSMGISAADIEPSASQQKPAGARTLGGDPVPAQGQNAEKKIPKWLKGFKK